jgi:hypothetical protein
MLILYKTPADYALWDLKDETLLQNDNIYEACPTPLKCKRFYIFIPFNPSQKQLNLPIQSGNSKNLNFIHLCKIFAPKRERGTPSSIRSSFSKGHPIRIKD